MIAVPMAQSLECRQRVRASRGRLAPWTGSCSKPARAGPPAEPGSAARHPQLSCSAGSRRSSASASNRGPVIPPTVEAAASRLGQGQPSDPSIARVRIPVQQADVAELTDQRRHGVRGHAEFGRGRRHRNSGLATHHPQQLDLRTSKVRGRPRPSHSPPGIAAELAHRRQQITRKFRTRHGRGGHTLQITSVAELTVGARCRLSCVCGGPW